MKQRCILDVIRWMEKFVKRKGNFKTIFEIDGIEVAHSSLLKWWRTDIVIKKGEEDYTTISKDSFWKWNLSIVRQGECILTLKTKFFGGITIVNPEGEIWKLKQKGASANQLIVVNAEDEEVMCLEKQGKWWNRRPYKVVLENESALPIQDETFPLMLVSTFGIFNQRGALIFPAFMFLQMIIKHFLEGQ